MIKFLIGIIVGFSLHGAMVYIEMDSGKGLYPGNALALLTKQCDKGKISQVHRYDCQTTINPVVHYKGGSVSSITWKEKRKQ